MARAALRRIPNGVTGLGDFCKLGDFSHFGDYSLYFKHSKLYLSAKHTLQGNFLCSHKSR